MVGARIKQAVIARRRLVVVDPRRVELAGYADVHLRGRPGSNVAVFNGLADVLVEEGLVDEAVPRRSAPRASTRCASCCATTRRSESRGSPECRRTTCAAPRGCTAGGRGRAIVWGSGITEHAHGTDGVRTLTNLAPLTGSVGTPDGGGVNPLRGQNNVQGASDMGALPDHPARLPVGRRRRGGEPLRGAHGA